MSTSVKAHRLRPELLPDEVLTARARVSSRQTNYLSLNARPPQSPFDDDWPGQLSSAGPRHDNDHINIRDIQILPTTDEILAVDRPPYIPKKNLDQAHFLQSPMLRLLDTQFRQLRFDQTEYLRDVCYGAAQKLVSEDMSSFPDYEAKQETTAGNQYFLYRAARFEEILSHERKGLLIRMSYACPSYLRGRRMHGSGRFQNPMLCAVIGIDREEGDLSVTFFEVHLAQSTDSMNSRGGDGQRAAVQLSFAQQDNHNDILSTVRYAQGLAAGRFVLVEFPRRLYAGFYWVLKRLQEMNTLDIAFASLIAPTVSLQPVGEAGGNFPRADTPSILPPAYSTRDGFMLDLGTLTKETVRFPASALKSMSRPLLLDFLRQETTLDEGQALAFAESLCRELAFTQGPPGTGKTFLGVALARTILASRVGQNLKPILVVCLTNHALDSFLGGLMKAGEKQLARIGRGCREASVMKYNIFTIARNTRITESKLQAKSSIMRRMQAIANELDSMTKDLNESRHEHNLHWHMVKAFLQSRHQQIYEQLTTSIETNAAKGFAFDYWSRGGDLTNLADLKAELEACLSSDTAMGMTKKSEKAVDLDEILQRIAQHALAQSELAGENNVWRLELRERAALLETWMHQIDHENLMRHLVGIHMDLHRTNLRLKSIREEIDKEVLMQQNIIGLTTTACASNWTLLKSMDLEIVICEEAAEVLEAHTLCTLLPSIEHAIFIGDPLQLRPEVQEPALSLELGAGIDYRLDESMCERFMSPIDPTLSAMPTSHLSVQRRMHPEISAITRLTYPYLQDHDQTVFNPAPIGIRPRTYWLDHAYPETSPSGGMKSYSNAYEVAMVVAFVQYLLRINGYTLGEIAILTPYNGQLAALNNALKSTCSIWLAEKDRTKLLDDGLLEEKDEEGFESTGDKEEMPMSNMLRVSTIDNFQGEEARIVILSAVRSGGATGFMKTWNRINVACSRARDGFYIIGNSRTLGQAPLWRKIIDFFDVSNNIGDSLRIGCGKHRKNNSSVSRPQDFESAKPCDYPCGEDLPCGHKCEETCHPAALHQVFKCHKPCEKQLKCGHTCQKECFVNCGKCTTAISQQRLTCGHSVPVICPDIVSECQTVIEKVELWCDHIKTLRCFQIGRPLECEEKCGKVLECGHTCVGICVDCAGGTHLPCSARCDKSLACGHRCDTGCHFSGGQETPCPPCQQPCQRECLHGQCRNSCSMRCDPCFKPHYSTCKHSEEEKVICSLPPVHLPCNEPCTKVLSCGHICPSLCGELCLEGKCPQCLTNEFPSKFVMLVPNCGDVIEVENLDQHVLGPHASIDPTGRITGFKFTDFIDEPRCLCGSSLRNINRYAVVIQLACSGDTIDRLLANIAHKVDSCSKKLYHIHRNLLNSWTAFSKSIRPNPLAAQENLRLIGERSAELITLSKDVVAIREGIIIPFHNSMTALCDVYPGLIPKYNLCFKLRAELLLSVIRFVLVEDSLRIAKHIAPLPDPSFELARMAILLKGFASEQCMLNRCLLTDVAAAVSALKSPSLYVELRLQESTLLHFEFLMWDKEVDPSLNPEAETKELIVLCMSFPDTAGRFYDKVLECRDLLLIPRHQRPIAPVHIYDGKHVELQRLWGNHKLGHLTTCLNKHPYSSETFKDGCPECGREINFVFTEEEAKRYGGQLSEDRFLEWMKSQEQVRTGTIFAGDPPRIKVLRNEEREE